MSSSRPTAREWGIAAAASLGIVAVASAPYLYGFAAAPPGYHFGGLLINPFDGNSYLAKMEIGRRGDWLFRLPFSAEPGDGTPIFLFYILLGHMARWIGASSIAVFHAARALAGFALLLTLFDFIARFFEPGWRRWSAWLLIAIGSGFGWLAVLFGGFTSDLWVAEAIVFLAVFSNSHFPLALALTLWLYGWLIPGLRRKDLTGLNTLPPRQDGLRPKGSRPEGAPTREKAEWWYWLGIVAATTALAHILPFALIPIGAISVVSFAVHALRPTPHASRLPPHAPRFTLFALASLPWLVYDFWLTQTHPALKIWSAQNQTPSPPVWDYLITFGLPLALASPGAWHTWKRRDERDVFLLTWFIANALLLYAPFSLQRRFSLGLTVPIGLLAIRGLDSVIAPRLKFKRPVLAAALCIGLAVPSNLIVLLASVSGILNHDRHIFLTAPEYHALEWLDTNAPPRALALASPEMSLFIPAYTLRRVIYAHPYETINAKAEKAAVTEFYAGGMTVSAAREFVAARGLDYVIFGPRERAMGNPPEPPALGLRLAWAEGDVAIYSR